MVLKMREPTYTRTSLDAGWKFKEYNEEGSGDFTAVSQFPTIVHLELLHQGVIPDPTVDLNRNACQYIGERKYLFQTHFTYRKSAKTPNVDLVFEGLDTFATVRLNSGKPILEADNMFVEYRVDITKQLVEGENELSILFDSAWLRGKELEEKQGFKNLFWNGDSSRLNVRKLGAAYSWDWGPRLMAVGPYKPIYLEAFDNRIDAVSVDVEVAPGLDSAIVTVKAITTDSQGEDVEIYVLDPSQGKVASIIAKPGIPRKLVLKQPQLWYPVGYGKQPLYTVKAKSVSGRGNTVSHRIGVRLLEVVQRPLQPREVPSSDGIVELVQPKGLSFFFRVNHIPIYSQGTNWIAPDTFLPRMTKEQYRESLIDNLLGSNQNMIRVWGGGQFESIEDFYDVCDEQGILVWQDMMMGCGSYPVNDDLLANIENEVTQNVKRLSTHPCMALWAGNNEDYMFAEIHKLTYDPQDTDPQSWLKTNWPARYYYEKLMPDICARYSPRVPYLPSSPFSPPSHDLPHRLANDVHTGDTHAWRVWMADQPRLPYQQYSTISGRFVSEFGMKSYPCLRTLEQHITDPKQRHPQSKTLDAWHMAPEDQRTLSLYLNENFRHGLGLPAYVYATQLLQAEAMDFAVRAFRRNWRGQGHEECAGNLIWQLNDCFPAVSWSLVDADYRKKLAWYAVKRAYAPITIGAERFVEEKLKPGANKHTAIDISKTTGLRVWTSNLTLQPVEAVLHLRMFKVGGEESVYESKTKIILEPNRSQEVMKYLPMPVGGTQSSDEVHETVAAHTVVALLLRSLEGEVLARFVEWPQPLRHLDLLPDGVDVIVKAGKHDGQRIVTLRASRPTKAFELFARDADVKLSDNCIDLVPDEERTIIVEGGEDSEILHQHLGCFGH